MRKEQSDVGEVRSCAGVGQGSRGRLYAVYKVGCRSSLVVRWFLCFLVVVCVVVVAGCVVGLVEVYWCVWWL